MGIPYTTALRVIRQGLQPLRRIRCQRLSDQNVADRLRWCLQMRRRLRAGGGERRLPGKVSPLKLSQCCFLDEKWFRLRPQGNSHNSRVWLPTTSTKRRLSAQARTPLRAGQSQSDSKGCMCTVLVDGRMGLLRPQFAKAGLKINADAFLEQLEQDILPHVLAGHPEGERICLLMDNAPSHAARRTRTAIRTHWPSVELAEWPANSPDLCPLDFGIFGSLLTQNPELTSSRNLHELRTKVVRALMKCEHVMATIHISFQRRIEACIAAAGHHFEESEHLSSSSSTVVSYF